MRRRKNARRKTLSGVKTVDRSSSQLSHIQHDDEEEEEKTRNCVRRGWNVTGLCCSFSSFDFSSSYKFEAWKKKVWFPVSPQKPLPLPKRDTRAASQSAVWWLSRQPRNARNSSHKKNSVRGLKWLYGELWFEWNLYFRFHFGVANISTFETSIIGGSLFVIFMYLFC